MARNIYQNSDRIPDSTIKFLNKYRARARLGEIEQRYHLQPINFAASGYSTRYEDLYSQTYTQRMVELTVAQEDLERMIDDIEAIDDLRKIHGPNIVTYINDAHKHTQQLSYEYSVRKNNPGVQLAWDKYQMMLKVAGGE